MVCLWDFYYAIPVCFFLKYSFDTLIRLLYVLASCLVVLSSYTLIIYECSKGDPEHGQDSDGIQCSNLRIIKQGKKKYKCN